MQAKGIVSAAEHWEQEKRFPFPRSFSNIPGSLSRNSGRGIRYRLISLWPVYQRNAPATELERKALDSSPNIPIVPVPAWSRAAGNNTFKAIYADRAISTACVTCHNNHPLSPKRDFKTNDVMGGMAITIPLD